MRPPNKVAEYLEQQVRSNQRNIVFPDTVRNEFRGYRRLQYGPALKPYQRIGAFMIAPLFLLLGVGLVISCIFLPRMAADEVNSIWFEAAMIPLGIVMACVGIAFAVFGFKLLKRVFRP